MPRRAIAREGLSPIDWPRHCTAPADSGSTPVTRLNSVDLPAPLGPISATMSPPCTPKLTSLTATRPPNCLRTACTSSSRSPRAGLARRGSGGASPQSRAREGFGRQRPTKLHSPSGAYFSTATSTTPKTIVS